MKQRKTNSDDYKTREQAVFSRTPWSRFAALRTSESTQRRDVLDFLIQRYWMPVYCFLRRKGYGEDQAEDLVQAFFEQCLRKDFFAKADQKRGRFRNFLLKSLNHFLANQHRAGNDFVIRKFKGGIVSLDELAESERIVVGPARGDTPDVAFHRAWILNLLQHALNAFEQDRRETGNEIHFEILRLCIIAPVLEGGKAPAHKELAARFKLKDAKQSSNLLITARFAFQHVLRQEIRLYAADDEEVAEEIRDIFRFCSGS